MSIMREQLKQNHISVCICTFKRPAMLAKALDGVISQVTDDKFTFDIIVVDNDRDRSAKDTVQRYHLQTGIRIIYDCESEQNISLTRNRAIRNAAGELIAFLDDDEFPGNTWLLNLYRTLLSSKVDGVLGPIFPHFEIPPPLWVVKSGLLERRSFSTDTPLDAKDMRTGNVLFYSRILECEATPFDPRFGRTGGEDGDFFRRMTGRGYKFTWCNEAPIYETVNPDRFKRTYFIKRAILRGVSEVELNRCSRMGVLKSLVACALYTSTLPFLFVVRHDLFMKYLVKDCDHISKVMALFGIRILKERDF